MKMILAVVALLAMVGCATTGTGDWLQVSKDGVVHAEMNTRDAGHQSCQSQAALMQRANPQLSVVCAHTRTVQPLPYSYKALAQQDGFKPSSPYVMRLATLRGCQAAVKAERAANATIIVDCNKT